MVINIPSFEVTTKKRLRNVFGGKNMCNVHACYELVGLLTADTDVGLFSTHLARLTAIPSCIAGAIYISWGPRVWDT